MRFDVKARRQKITVSCLIDVVYAPDYVFQMRMRNPDALATVISFDQFKEYGWSLDDGAEKEVDAIVLLRESLRKVGTEDELNAIINHEFLHFILGHRIAKSDEENLLLDAKVDEHLTEEEKILISNLAIRFVAYQLGKGNG